MVEASTGGYKPRMQAMYDDRIAAAMTERFGYKNKLEVPRIEKIVLNMGVGEAVNDTKKVTLAAADLGLMYKRGIGVDADADEAAYWFREAERLKGSPLGQTTASASAGRIKLGLVLLTGAALEAFSIVVVALGTVAALVWRKPGRAEGSLAS